MHTTPYPMTNLKRLKPRFLWFLAIVLLLAGFCSAVWPQPDAALLADVAEQLARHFPKVAGEVVKVEADDIYLGLGAREGMMPGLQLTLFRPQDAAPETDAEQAVSRVEEAIGYVIVEKVFERYALARLLATAGTEARRGDKVRITSGPVVLGVLPIVDESAPTSRPAGLTAALQSALQVNERFHVVPANRILLWALEQDTPLENGLSPDLLLRMAESLRFSYAVVGMVKDVGGDPVLEVVLLSPRLQRLVASGSAFLPSPSP